ncbi:MAG: hypothetical protein WC548_03770 [Candidatus Pacearchaeota archaeon]
MGQYLERGRLKGSKINGGVVLEATHYRNNFVIENQTFSKAYEQLLFEIKREMVDIRNRR